MAKEKFKKRMGGLFLFFYFTRLFYLEINSVGKKVIKLYEQN